MADTADQPMGEFDAPADFQLSMILPGHESDVRAISQHPDGSILTGSRDATNKIWGAGSAEEVKAGTYYSLTKTVFDHEHWVNTITPIEMGTDGFPAGGFVTGSQNGTIKVFDAAGTVVKKLVGHTAAVSSLSWLGGHLLSGSWDGTAREWDLGSGACLRTLPDHENAVCVLGLGDGRTVVTGSAGRQVGNAIAGFCLRFWRDGAVVRRCEEHAGPIRDLAAVPGIGLISASNDGSLKLYTCGGDCIQTFAHPPAGPEGRPPFVFSVTALPSGEYAAATDDGAVTIWRGQQCVQTLPHPGTVWAVAALRNGDLVTGCSDKTARVFSRDPARAASPQTIAQHVAALEEMAARAAAAAGGVDASTLPSTTQMQQMVGKKDGAVKMFNKGGVAFAYSWSAASRTWIEIGEVTGAPGGGGAGGGGKQTVDGKQYDKVIPVEMEDPSAQGGLRTFRLGFNMTDNPYTAAQTFIDSNKLPQHHLQQIAEFIQQNRGPSVPTLGMGGASGSAASAAGGGGGGAATATAAAAPAPLRPPAFKSFPCENYLQFETAKFPAMEQKLTQFNTELAAEGAAAAAALSGGESAALAALFVTLKDTSRYHATSITPGQLLVVRKLCGWPPARVFPCLDLLRVLLTHPHAASLLAAPDSAAQIIDLLLRLNSAAASLPITLLSLRVLVNLTAAASARPVVAARVPQLLETFGGLTAHASKGVRFAAATLLRSLATLLRGSADPQAEAQAISAVVQLCVDVLRRTAQSSEGDLTIRAGTALGTLLAVEASPRGVLLAGTAYQAADAAGLAELVASHPLTCSTEKASMVLKDLQTALEFVKTSL